MEQNELDDLQNFLENLGLDSEKAVQAELLFKKARKRHEKLAFMVNRTATDKSIATRLLEQSVDRLEAQNAELSQQKKLLEESTAALERHLEKLERSYRELEQFSYIASHDLKSPLRNIISYAQLLERRYRGQLGADADEFLKFIVTGARHMNDVICDLLEYARTGQGDQAPTEVNMSYVFDLIENNLAQEICETDAQIIRETAMPVVFGYQTSMVQLFQNLIANAIKFRNGSAPVIRLRHEKGATDHHFLVADNGLGIPEGFEKKVFEPFQRLNVEVPGMGMGLAICKKIAHLHRGKIWFESEVGRGTDFHFTMPERAALKKEPISFAI